MLQAQQVETGTWRWWWRWLTNTRRRCGGKDEWPGITPQMLLIGRTCNGPLSSPSDGCGPRPVLSWSWRPLWASVGSATPPWQPSTPARWSMLYSGAPSVRRAFTSSSGKPSSCFTVSDYQNVNSEQRCSLFFFRELSVGRGSTATFGGGAMPKINSVDAWDGRDGQVSRNLYLWNCFKYW